MTDKSLCDTCARRMKHIVFVGFSTVAWDGGYTCGPLSEEILGPKAQCERYEPKRQGQLSLEAFV